ncbi:NAD(P)H-dependent oxidoreductase [Cellulomonas sp. Sa3CUA2]|uniref:NAD(P)H-dependent oxidoreductase n=1 Tax=Cellulomonas avistercoris TaxID=2762242 RepID=A0ABR8QEX0_9CELL|nr:NAD(P)H-dependent oxidoreductase [Cellulomonas avistercoris]MBD7918960.1 NAD(P)H-dependent oxidoreductase [Cellulomonas avistercoris]
MTVAIVVGNPKPASRTAGAAHALVRRLTGSPSDVVVDVVDLGPGVLGWGDAGVEAAVKAVAGADLVVVASPTYKASYTGLLKCFLDQFATGDGLRGVTAVPLMLGAGPAHAMAPDLLLKPVLVELGATCPAPGLYARDATAAELPEAEAWVQVWGHVLLTTAHLRKEPS